MPQVAYIGIATGDTIRRRLRKYVTDRGNWALGRLGDPARFTFVYYRCDPRTAREIESYVVTHAKPPFNTRPELRHLIPSIAVHCRARRRVPSAAAEVRRRAGRGADAPRR